jgi:2-desacetyl-2-hydroxyethyl bacteriochlorophyllide A dehydrogenase
MGKLVRFSAPRSVEIVEVPDAPLAPSQVRVHTLFSGISAGTELTAYRGSNPYLNKRWDDDRRLFVPGQHSLHYPVDGWGYEEVGRVVELGSQVGSVSVGDLIWGAWGHRASVALEESYARTRTLASDADPIIGIFSEIGAIALNVVLDADIHVGETVAVFGLGVPGQIVTQLARLNGARVVAVDRVVSRLDMAARLGADEVIDGSSVDAGERIRELTDGRGADVTLEVSGSYRALHEAVRATAYGARVVAAGFFQGEGVGLALGEEFHHNRIQLACSQISGVAPGLMNRWNKDRLLHTAMMLASTRRLDLRPLVTEVVPLDDAAAVFASLDASPENALQVVLEFPQ